MKDQSKTHLRIRDRYWLICHPSIEQDLKETGEALALEAENLPEDFILSPILFSPDKRIYFHGGDFLPYTHLPMPWADSQLYIGQYPEVREVGFSPLFCFLISDSLYKKLPPDDFYGEDLMHHAEYVMEAKKLGAKCFAAAHVSVIWPTAYAPEMGAENFEKTVRRGLIQFQRKWSKTINEEYRFPMAAHTVTALAGGYNFHAYNLLKSLFKKRIRVYYQFAGGTNDDEPPTDCPFIDDQRSQYMSMRLPQVTLCHGTNHLKNSGDFKIGFTTTEVTGIPHDWVMTFNELDEVWATSEHAKKAFIDSGVKTPVYVIGEGVDPDYFHPEITPFAKLPSQKFRFLSNFAWGKRKGVDVLFEAFRREFSKEDDVCLMLKVLPSYQGHDIKQEMKNVYQRRGAAPVYLYDVELEKYEMGQLYTSAHCFLWPSRGEGYGLPVIEAMACGLPVIISNWSAHLEFATRDGKPKPGVLLIDGKVEPYEKGDSIYYPGFDWFNPSVDSLRKQMREVYENYQKYRTAALETSIEIRKNWHWGVSTDRAIERLKVYRARGDASENWGDLR